MNVPCGLFPISLSLYPITRIAVVEADCIESLLTKVIAYCTDRVYVY
jgi:hypothetical protein